MKTVYQNPWFSVVQDGHYHYLCENGSDNGAAVLLLQAGKLLLLTIKRAPFDGLQLEIPRGYGEPGEQAEVCALREVYEETGLQLSADQLQFLGYIKPNSAIVQSQVSLFVATLPADGALPTLHEQTEGIQGLNAYDLDQVRTLIRKGEISDSFTLAALGCYLIQQPDVELQEASESSLQGG